MSEQQANIAFPWAIPLSWLKMLITPKPFDQLEPVPYSIGSVCRSWIIFSLLLSDFFPAFLKNTLIYAINPLRCGIQWVWHSGFAYRCSYNNQIWIMKRVIYKSVNLKCNIVWKRAKIELGCPIIPRWSAVPMAFEPEQLFSFIVNSKLCNSIIWTRRLVFHKVFVLGDKEWLAEEATLIDDLETCSCLLCVCS